MQSPVAEQRQAITAAAIGTVLVCAYATLALVQILWLNPHAAVPGVQLEQIQEDVADANESMVAPFVIGFMSIGPIVAVTALIISTVRNDLKPRTMAVSYLWILALGPMAYFMASFGPGMALADTYGITGGDHSPWAWPLYVVSGLALVALTLMGISSTWRRRKRPSAKPFVSSTGPQPGSG